MIQFIVGEKGQGKTKRLIDMTNGAAKTTDGHIVFIDTDRRHMYDLHYDIRFVETAGFPLYKYREFVGFLCGILSQDSDIKEIYVDGLTNILKTLTTSDLTDLLPILEKLSAEHEVNFIISVNYKYEDLPEAVKTLVINI